jgi:hypothetical protein
MKGLKLAQMKRESQFSAGMTVGRGDFKNTKKNLDSSGSSKVYFLCCYKYYMCSIL